MHHTAGVEVTTGPLGQGFANAVGMGVAERWLRARFGPELCDHHTYVICSDGDLMEGISHEAASLAGHLRLGRLVYVYDDNHITIDGDDRAGPAPTTWCERFEGYGWHVEHLGEMANDVDGLEAALRRAAADDEAPSLLVLRSHIGWPSPKFTDTAEAHGNPLGDDEIRATKEILGLPPDETFWVPDDVLELYRSAGRRGRDAREAWEKRLAAWDGDREAYEACIEPAWAARLAGGAADVDGRRARSPPARPAAPACRPWPTRCPASSAAAPTSPATPARSSRTTALFSADDPAGRQIHFGVREHGMGGVMNGMAAHGGVLPVGGTFFVFSDYMRPAVRLAAMSECEGDLLLHARLGRPRRGRPHPPADRAPRVAAGHAAAAADPPGRRQRDRGRLAHRPRVRRADRAGPLPPGRAGAAGHRPPTASRGAPTCSVDARRARHRARRHGQRGLSVRRRRRDCSPTRSVTSRVVSMPSWELFEAQSDEYQTSVLPPEVPTLAVEAGASLGWDRWADDSVSLDRFGASAPGDIALANLGYTPENVADRARQLVHDLQEVDG